ncbi:MAG: TonB-dependent receptor, partial [Candidatus Binatia bacterium]
MSSPEARVRFDAAARARSVAAALLLLVALRGAAAADDDLDGLPGEDAPAAGPAAPASTPPPPERRESEPSPAPSAAEPPERRGARRRVIEEIIVTAQKKEQAIMDVPLSISVIDSDFMAQQGLIDLQDISVFVPNTGVRASRGAAASVRGFTTSSLNKAFDQSVGLVVDGTPYNRVPYLEMGLFDVDRIEVLRGPQGHLFGKSSSAGVLNVITARPTDEFGGLVDLQLGELGRRRAEAAIGGPLVAGLVNFRLAALSDEEDGFIRNTFAATRAGVPERLREKEIRAGRVKLEVPDAWGSSIGLSFERMDIFYNSSG